MASYTSSPSCPISFPSPFPSTFPMLVPSTLAHLNIKLDSSNYTFWKSQILPSVRAHGLQGFLLGTHIKPDEYIIDPANPQAVLQNPDHVSWIRLDQFLMSWLFSSISRANVWPCRPLQVIRRSVNNLEQLFSTKSKARVLQLRLLLQTTKKGTRSIEDYILKMKNIASSLMAAGQSISDDELILYILGSLRSEFESVIVNLTSRDSVSLQEVQYILQTHEMRLESLNATTMFEFSNTAAHIVQKHPNFMPNSRGFIYNYSSSS